LSGCGWQATVSAGVGRSEEFPTLCKNQRRSYRGAPQLISAVCVRATLYDGVGSVKRHVDFASHEGSFFLLPKRIFSLSCISTKARSLNLAVILVPPTIYSVTLEGEAMIRSSDAAIARGSKAPNQPSDGLAPTRVAPGLPCLRTSRAYAAPLRSIQYIRTANFRAMATLATACPRRNFNRW
jgi:hypothetical protein